MMVDGAEGRVRPFSNLHINIPHSFLHCTLLFGLSQLRASQDLSEKTPRAIYAEDTVIVVRA